MLSLVMVAALAIPPGGDPPSMSAPRVVVVGRITVKYRELRIGDMPPQRAPSFQVVAHDNRVTYPLLIKSDQKVTLERLAETGAPAAVAGSMLDINGRPFILVESVKEQSAGRLLPHDRPQGREGRGPDLRRLLGPRRESPDRLLFLVTGVDRCSPS